MVVLATITFHTVITDHNTSGNRNSKSNNGTRLRIHDHNPKIRIITIIMALVIIIVTISSSIVLIGDETVMRVITHILIRAIRASCCLKRRLMAKKAAWTNRTGFEDILLYLLGCLTIYL